MYKEKRFGGGLAVLEDKNSGSYSLIGQSLLASSQHCSDIMVGATIRRRALVIRGNLGPALLLLSHLCPKRFLEPCSNSANPFDGSALKGLSTFQYTAIDGFSISIIPH